MVNNGMSGVNKAIATVNAVAKKGTKVFANALPLVSIGTTVYEAYADSGGDMLGTAQRVVTRFTGFGKHGEFLGDELGKGLGRLLGAVAGRWLIKQFV